LICLLVSFSQTTIARTKVKAIALFNGKAMLSINGKRAKIIAVGQSLQGVKLIASTTDKALVEIDGESKELKLGGGVVLSKSLGAKPPAGSQNMVQLWSDNLGFFRVDGEINGNSTEFLVDTGANLVVLSSRTADRMGISYLEGIPGISATASGTAPIYVIQAESISIAGIELKDIRTGVVVGNFPLVPLLGMTFLDKLDMQRSGDIMKLTKRF
jgi:aspartyl protease family protein